MCKRNYDTEEKDPVNDDDPFCTCMFAPLIDRFDQIFNSLHNEICCFDA